MAFEFHQLLRIDDNLDRNDESDIEIGEISDDEDSLGLDLEIEIQAQTRQSNRLRAIQITRPKQSFSGLTNLPRLAIPS